MNKLMLVAISAALSACNNACEGSDCSASETDSKAKKAMLAVTAFRLGEPEDCTVNYEGDGDLPDGSFLTARRDSVELPVGEYTLSIGSGNCGGVPCHDGPDGLTWVTPKQAVTLGESGQDVQVSLNRHFNAIYRCTRDSWIWSDSAPDNKGQQYEDDESLGDQRIKVVDGVRVHPNSNRDMNVFDKDDYMEVDGDTLLLVEVGGANNNYITDSWIERSSFFFTFVQEDFGVYEVTCVER